MTVRNRFWELLKYKEISEGRGITMVEVEATTGITQRTLYLWRDNKVAAFSSAVIEALCRYFDVGIEELLVLDKDEE